MVTEEENRLSRSSRIVLKEDHLRRIDVPGDGSCLFWAVSVPFLLQVKNNSQLFLTRFERLFGAKELSKSHHVRHLLTRFHPSRSNVQIYNDKILTSLVTQVFRRKLVEKMSEFEDELFESVTINDFIDMKNESFVTDGTFRDKFKSAFTFEIEGHNVNLDKLRPEKLNNDTLHEINGELDKISGNRFTDLQKFKFRMYLESMKSCNSWGGNLEIQIMSSMLGCEILVHSENQLVSGAENSIIICLFNNQQVHYQFGLIKAQFLIEFIDQNSEENSLLYLNIGVDDVNYQNSNKSTLLHFAAKHNHAKLIHSLINQGAEANTENHLAQTPLDIATTLNSRDAITALNIYTKQDLTISTSPNKQTNNALTINQGVNANLVSKEGGTPRLVTKQGDNSYLVSKEGCTPRLVTKQGDNSFLMSKEGGTPSLVTKQGDNSYSVSKEGGTPSLVTKQGDNSYSVSKDGGTATLVTKQGDNLFLMSKEGGTTSLVTKQGDNSYLISKEGGSAISLSIQGDNSYLMSKEGGTPSLVSKQDDNSYVVSKPGGSSLVVKNQGDGSYLVSKPGGNTYLVNKNDGKVSLWTEQTDLGGKIGAENAEVSLKYNSLGRTILHTAAEEGNDAILSHILSSLGTREDLPFSMLDAPINGQRKQTALHLAAKNNRVKVVKILLENKAKVDVKDVNNDGDANWTPLHYAAEKGHLLVVRLLVEKGGAEVDVLDRTKGTPLQRAVRFGQLKVVKYLVKVGADVNSKDQTFISILSYAAKAGCLQTVHFLVEKNAEINTVDKNSITPLHHAANGGKWDIVRYLAERGADANVESSHGKTALFKVVKSGQWGLAKCLMENGALTKGLSEKQVMEVFRKNSVSFEGEDSVFSVIACGNVEFLERYFHDLTENNPEFLVKVLPKVYEEIKTLNLPISQSVSLFIENQLIEGRLFSDKITHEIQENDVENIERRISLIIHGINKLEEISSSDGNEISDAFLFVGKFIAQNMQILKEQVRDQLPWIEMQFCLIQFIYSHLEPRKADMIDTLVLNKARLMKHLLNFKSQLEKFENPDFKGLKEDYEILKDVYSLNRIESYVNLAFSVDLEEDVLVGQQVIFRALHVTGECLKTSNMSDKVRHLLIALAPKKVLKFVKSLRLSRVEHFEKMIDQAFLLGVQKDLIKLKDEVTFILLLKKNEALKTFFRKIFKCESVDEAKRIVRLVSSCKQNVVFNRVEELIEKLKREVKNATEIQQIYLKKLENVVERYRLKLENAEKIEAGNSLIDLLIKDGAMDLVRKIISELKNEAEFSEEILKNVADFYNSLDGPSLSIYNLYNEIILISEFVANIDQHRTKVSIKIDFDEKFEKVEKIERNVNEIFQSISKELSNFEVQKQFLSEVEIKKQIYRSKNSLISYYSKIMAIYDSVVKFYDRFVDVYNALIDFFRLLFDFYTSRMSCKSLGENELIKLVEENDLGAILRTLNIGNVIEKDALAILMEKIRVGQLRKINFEEILSEFRFEKLIDEIEHKILIDENAFKKLLKKFRESKFDLIDKSKTIKDEEKVASLIDENQLKVLIDRIRRELSIDESVFSALIANAQLKIEKSEILFQDFSLSKCKIILQSVEKIDSYSKLVKECEISNSSKAFNEFINTLSVSFGVEMENVIDKALEKFKNDRIFRLKSYFFENVDILTKIFSSENSDLELLTSLKKDNLRLAAENLVLNLSRTLDKLSLFESNKFFLDEFSPVLVGKNLLEFLTRGDPLISVTNTNYQISLITHFHLFRREFHATHEFYPREQLIGKTTRENIPELEKRYQQNLKTSLNKTNLPNAIQSGETQSVIKSIDTKTRNAVEDTLLHFAARASNLDVFQHLLDRGLSLYHKNKCGHNALHAAVTSGSDAIIEHLLDRGYDPSLIVENGETLLHLAIQHGQLRIVELLLRNDADTEAVNNEGVTPIVDAVTHGCKDIVTELLNAASDVETRDKSGKTLVHLAVRNLVILDTLLILDAEDNALDDDRNTPLHLACRDGELESVKMLLYNEVSVTSTNKDGATALHLALQEGHAEIVTLLVKENVEVDAVTLKKDTALHLACFRGHFEVTQVLLRNGADLNARNGDDVTALHIASVMGHVGLIDLLVDYTVDIDSVTKGDATALQMAAENGHTDVFKRLVERGANTRHKGSDGLTALHSAAILENVELMEFILKKDYALINVTDDKLRTALHLSALTNKIKSAKFLIENNAELNVKDFEGVTPLQASAMKGHVEIFDVLLRNGADVNAKDAKGWTALHSVAQNNNKAIFETLMKRKMDVNVQCNEGLTALHLASQNGHLEMVKLLISNGSNVNLTGFNGWSSLHFASLSGHFEIVRHLLENGAKNDFSNSNASTPLHLATQNGHFRVLKLLLDNNNGYVNSLARNKSTALQSAAENGDVSCVTLLINNGADANATFREKWTALHLAAMKGHVEVVKALIGKTDQVDARLENGCTPLHLAAQGNYVDVVELLIENGADVNSTYLNGKTSLHNCSAFGHVGSVLSLLRRGVTVDAKDDNQRTALHYAADKGHVEVVKVLLEYDADVNAKDLANWTALHLATDEGHVDTVDCLLANGASTNIQTENGSSALHLASNTGFLSIVEAILDVPETEVDLVDVNCHTPLHFASQVGHTEIVQRLLAKRANVDILNKTCATPLHLASFGGHFETVRLLLNGGATVDYPNKDELTPLHVAALYRHSKVTLELLKFGADVNSKSSANATPLHMATEKNDVTIVGHLLSRENVDVNAKKLDGVTPLHLASYLGFLNVANMLVDAGAEVDSKTKQNYTPLHLATQSKHCDVIKLLAERKADVNATFDGVTTALQIAVQSGLASVVETLLENGADVEDRAIFLAVKSGFTDVFKALLRRKNGSTALIRAVKCKNVTLVKVILEEVNEWSYDEVNEVVNGVDGEGKNALICAAENGFLLASGLLMSCACANVNQQTTDGMTALHLSAKNGHERIVDMLIASNADANLKDVEGRTAFDLVNEKINSDAEKYEPIAALLLSVTN